ncbi:YdbH family protein [Escherichia coli]
MLGKYKAVLALLLLIILVPLTLLMTLGLWVPTLAGIWLPLGTRIALDESPRITRKGLIIPDLRYLVGDCQLAHITNASLSHPSRWLLSVGTVELDSACLAKLPQTEQSPAAPKTLAQWQSMLPNTWINIDKLIFSPWQEWQGKLSLALTSDIQQLCYQGEKVKFQGQLKGQQLTVSELDVAAFENQPPVKLVGEFTMPLVPDGLPVSGHATATLNLPQEPSLVDAELDWQENSGRLSVLTQGQAGKGNAVLNFGPGKLSMDNSQLPLQLTGEAKQADLILYARLPAQLSGSLSDPTLTFEPGALLRSKGRVIDSLDIDEIRWPLAGVKVTQRGVDGRLQAILQAHENELGDFVLHMDGLANDFLPDAGRWQWRYWGKGSFTPMNATWDVAGKGEWHDSTITLTDLSTGFDQLQYGTMTVEKPRLILDKPVVWGRDAQHPSFSGALSLDAGQTLFTGGSVLPPSTLKFSVDGRDPTYFLFKGDLHAGEIGPVRVNGRWDGIRLRGNAWWPKQSLTVFQPLVPPDWKMNLRDGELYAQVAFSAAPEQGFRAGGHGVLKGGSAWMPDNQVNGVDFVLPFRFADGAWHLGTRGPVTLRIAEVINLVTAKNITADLQGRYPWTEEEPLLLTDVSVDVLGGNVLMKQLRMPQHDPALLRLNNLSSSELVSAVNPKQFAMSGAFSGALPLWLNNEKWIVKDGWLANSGPMTLRLDKDTADAVVKDNMTAGSAINWLRYMEISRSSTKINLDNLGLLTMQANITGTSRVDGKSGTVNLNYHHEENIFTLWRSLRFGDNLQAWLEQNARLPGNDCPQGKECEDKQ